MPIKKAVCCKEPLKLTCTVIAPKQMKYVVTGHFTDTFIQFFLILLMKMESGWHYVALKTHLLLQISSIKYKHHFQWAGIVYSVLNVL